MDITPFMQWFIGQVVRLVTHFFSLLGNITFNGVSLLVFGINIIVIGLCLDLLVISARTRRVKNEAKSSGKASEGDSNDD